MRLPKEIYNKRPEDAETMQILPCSEWVIYTFFLHLLVAPYFARETSSTKDMVPVRPTKICVVLHQTGGLTDNTLSYSSQHCIYTKYFHNIYAASVGRLSFGRSGVIVPK